MARRVGSARAERVADSRGGAWLAEDRASRVRDFDPRYLNLPSPPNSLVGRGHESGANQAVEQLSCPAMGQHERLGATVRAAGEEGEGATALAIEYH